MNLVFAWLAAFIVMVIGHLLGIDPSLREVVLVLASLVVFWWVAEEVGS